MAFVETKETPRPALPLCSRTSLYMCYNCTPHASLITSSPNLTNLPRCTPTHTHLLLLPHYIIQTQRTMAGGPLPTLIRITLHHTSSAAAK